MRVFFILLVFFVVGVSSVEAGESGRSELWWSVRWCRLVGGEPEVVTPDGARADCVVGNFAVEFDWAKNWAEALGQALFYGVALGKRSAVILLLTDPVRDRRYVERLVAVVKSLGGAVSVGIIDARDDEIGGVERLIPLIWEGSVGGQVEEGENRGVQNGDKENRR